MQAVRLKELSKMNKIMHKGVRFYQEEGSTVLYPSVTSVLNVVHKPSLTAWGERVATAYFRTELEMHSQKIMMSPSQRVAVLSLILDAQQEPLRQRDAASDFGTKVHDIIDRIITDKPQEEIRDDMKPIFEGFNKWKESCGLTFVAGDTAVVSKEYAYAGSCDAIARNKSGKLVVLDWKTTNMIMPTYAMQVAAYAKAIEEMSLDNEKVEEAIVVQFDKKTGECTPRRVHRLEEAFEGFKACIILWSILQHNLFDEKAIN